MLNTLIMLQLIGVEAFVGTLMYLTGASMHGRVLGPGSINGTCYTESHKCDPEKA